MRILVLMTSGPEAVVALVAGGRIAAEQHAPGARGLAEALPRMVEAVRGEGFDLVAAIAGPGSFTGIRAGLALAHGLALGAGVDVIAVTLGEALEAGWGAPLLVATDAGRGRLFVERGGRCVATTADDLVLPPGVRLAGDAAPLLAGPRAARLLPDAIDVAAAALARLDGRLPARAVAALRRRGAGQRAARVAAAAAGRPRLNDARLLIGVRLAGAADAPALACVHAAAFGAGERWDALSIATLLATAGTWALATTGPWAMAMFRVAADEAELLTVAVHPDERRLGAGRLLLEAGMLMAARGGARTLFLEVSERNVAACALYGGAGFVPVGRRRGYYPDGADAVVMSRRLGA